MSLTAAILNWLEFTPDAAVLVCSRDGFIDWAVSSQRAVRNGAYFKTRGQAPIPVPEASLAACAATPPTRARAELPCGVWFDGFEATELAIASGRYDMTLSLLVGHFLFVHIDALTTRKCHEVHEIVRIIAKSVENKAWRLRRQGSSLVLQRHLQRARADAASWSGFRPDGYQPLWETA